MDQRYLVMVDCKGGVTWYPSAKFRSGCQIDMRRFPFDEQRLPDNYGRPMEQGRPLYFCPVISIFLLPSFFPHLISAVGDWVSTKATHALVQI